jgi:dUTP pyrophosphatase
MCNQIGIIDADYYNNAGNEGHMWIALQNEGTTDWVVNKGDRVVQGIFVKYLLTDDDSGAASNRQGGLGSTNKEE